MSNYIKGVLFFLLVVISSSKAQTNFCYGYSGDPGVYTYYPTIVRAPDGSIFQYTSTSLPIYITLNRFDSTGNILWSKRLNFPVQISNMIRITLLSDSSLALIKNAESGGKFYVTKIDFDGNILWSRGYNLAAFEYVDYINSFMNGGLVVSNYHQLIFINSQGNIERVIDYQNIYIDGLVSKNQNSLTVSGRSFTTGNKFIFDCDTSGAISNSITYTIPGDTLKNGYLGPSNFISYAPTGGLYCILPLKESPTPRFILLYLNNQNQPIWARRINSFNYSSVVQSCLDNGCLVTSSLLLNNLSAVITKFDSLGTMVWSKIAGDTSTAITNYRELLSIIPDANTGWYYTFATNYRILYHSDSDMTNLCSFQNFAPNIDTVSIVFNPISFVYNYPTLVSDTVFASTSFKPLTRHDGCDGSFIDVFTAGDEFQVLEEINIYPNPASEILFIKTSINFRRKKIMIIDMLGKTYMETYNTFSEFEISLNKLHSGTYVLIIMSEKGEYVRKLFLKN